MCTHRSASLGLVLGLVLCHLPGLGQAQTQTAVVPLLSVNLQEAEVDALTETLAQGLHQASAHPVRGGRSVRRRLPEAGVAPDCPSDPTCVSQLRARLEVQALVFVILTKVGTHIQVDPSICLTEQAEARPALRGPSEDLLRPEWVKGHVQDWLPRRAAPPVQVAGDPSPERWRRPSWPVWVAGAVALTALSVGVGLGVHAKNLETDLVADGCELRACAEQEIDALSRTARGADAAFIIGGVAAAASLGLYYVLDVGPEPLVLRVHGQGLAIAGQF